MVAIICMIVAAFLTAKLGKRIFRNTIGTYHAYIWRYGLIYFIILFVLARICMTIGIM